MPEPIHLLPPDAPEVNTVTACAAAKRLREGLDEARESVAEAGWYGFIDRDDVRIVVDFLLGTDVPNQAPSSDAAPTTGTPVPSPRGR